MRKLFPLLVVLLWSGLCQAATVKGKIVSPDGAPVSGAKLWAGPLGRMRYAKDDVHTATTGDDGAFTFEFPDTPGKRLTALLRVQSDKFALADTLVKEGDNTVRLVAPKTVRGIVKDGAGKPVADVTVRLAFAPIGESVFREDMADWGVMGYFSLMTWAAMLPPIETRSGPDGKWNFDNVNAAIVSLRDDRFAGASGFSNMPGAPNNGDFISLVAKPGAGLKGRIVTPEGKPLVGAYIMGGAEMFGTPTLTDADGAFTLNGLTTGRMALVAFPPNDEWVIPPLTLPQNLEAGKVTTIPDWKASRGMQVTGIIVDKDTNKPIAGAMVNSALGGSSKTDAEGRFATRMVPGQAYVTVSHPEYAAYFKNFTNTGDKATYDAGRIALTRALILEGRVVDDKGQPLKGVAITGTGNTGNNPAANPEDMMPQIDTTMLGDDGKFKLRLKAGKVTLVMQSEEWELTPARTTELTLTDKTAPVELKARKLEVLQVSGRVVTPAGAPVAGATVVVNFSRSNKAPGGRPEDEYLENLPDKNADTDAQGKFTVEFRGAMKTIKVGKVEGDAYLLRKAGEAKQANGTWTFSDTIVAALTGQITGRILNANGTPAVGAFIASPEAATFEPVKTDDQGRFTLKKLPEGEALIIAALDRNTARLKVTTGQTAELKLAQPDVFMSSMKRQFFEGLSKISLGELDEYWKFIGSDKMLALGLQKDGALPAGELDLTKADWNKAAGETLSVLRSTARNDVPWFLENAAALLQKIPQPKPNDDKAADDRFDTQAVIVAVAAVKGDAQAKAWANEWLNTALKQKDTPNANAKNAGRMFRLAGIAGALKRNEADGLVINALNFAELAGKKAIEDNSRSWGQYLSPGGLALFSPVLDEWSFGPRYHAVEGATQGMMQFDYPMALPFFEKLRALKDEAPPATETKPDPAREQAKNEWDQKEGMRRNALAKYDPAMALAELEKRPESTYDWYMRAKIAGVAYSKGLDAVVVSAVKPMLDVSTQAGFLAYAAALVKRSDKELSDKLLQAAAKRFTERDENDYTLPEYGFYQAAFDPAQARLVLEDLWQRSAIKTTPQNEWQVSNMRGRTAGSMIALDPIRSLEMLGELTNGYYTNWARARIVAYLLTDEANRAVLRGENS